MLHVSFCKLRLVVPSSFAESRNLLVFSASHQSLENYLVRLHLMQGLDSWTPQFQFLATLHFTLVKETDKCKKRGRNR